MTKETTFKNLQIYMYAKGKDFSLNHFGYISKVGMIISAERYYSIQDSTVWKLKLTLSQN